MPNTIGVPPASATSTNNPSTQTWNYDNAGNWNSTARTIGNNTTTENRTHSAADQINTIAGNAATHDLKGNLTEYEINGKEYKVEYDLDNRIVKVEVDNDDVEYRYDAFGRRVIRKEGSTNTSLIWWGNSECAEHKHQAGTTVIQNDIMEHPSRLNSVIARAKDGSKFKLEWYHRNYLDHVYAVSDDDGDILEHYRYTAFGEVTIYDENGAQVTATQIDNHILWNTRRRDEVTGYYMYKYRHYSPELGRWPSRDPLADEAFLLAYIKTCNRSINCSEKRNLLLEQLREEVMKNLYMFIDNDAINNWDTLGLKIQWGWKRGIVENDSNFDVTVQGDVVTLELDTKKWGKITKYPKTKASMEWFEKNTTVLNKIEDFAHVLTVPSGASSDQTNENVISLIDADFITAHTATEIYTDSHTTRQKI